MGIIGKLFEGIDRLFASAFGLGNTFGESNTLREVIAKERETTKETRER